MTVILLDGEAKFICSSYLPDFKDQNLILVTPIDQHTISIKANRSHWVGRITVKDLTIVVPPPFNNRDFLLFLLYSDGFDLSKMKGVGDVGDFFEDRNSDLAFYLALSYLSNVKNSIGHNISKAYEKISERKLILHGRPVFKSGFGNHPSTGITCEINRLSSDNEINQIVLFGLKIAFVILSKSSFRSSCSELIFLFRSICQERSFHLFSIENALITLPRNHEHYRSSLILLKYLIEGSQPDFFYGRSAKLPNFEIYLPSVFEKFVFRLIKGALEHSWLSVKAQEANSKAIIDEEGRSYRRTIPDIVIGKQGIPIAVLDCKFKPRYFATPPNSIVPRGNRVSNSDIYQIFFYQQRLMVNHKLDKAPKAAIVAPSLYGREFQPDSSKRTVIWPDKLVADGGCRFVLLPLPLRDLLDILSSTGSEVEALRFAPEINKFISDLLDTPTISTEEEMSSNCLT
ncbi:5-methylcytosine restriction system specificity protein McrC [Vreelandella populi]|uniref:5-methylcytosine restriction system specificity protein McrC n=1 Tax=Vreelandella populi TaxID=2498858 RepID=UPI00163BCEFA|nr:hypothetical protein [Halomonas populi]